MGFETPLTGAQRVARRRATLRAQGLRPRTFWLPDTSTEAFRAEAARACAAIDASWDDDQMPGWIDAMIDDVVSDLPPPDGLV